MRPTAGLLPITYILFGVHWGAWLAAITRGTHGHRLVRVLRERGARIYL